MDRRLTDSQMLKLVKIYRDYECLWKVNSLLYKNQVVRKRAYKEISDKLKIPGITAKHIPKKIKNLRSSYYQELKRIDRSIKAGARGDAVYTPKVSWFTTADAILRPYRVKRETVSYNDENSNNSDNEQETLHNTQSVDNSEAEESYADNNIYIVEIGDDTYKGNARNQLEVDQNEPSSSRFDPLKTSLRTRANINKADKDINEALEKIDKIANSLTKTTNSVTETKKDEFDVFGEYIATTLRTLPRELAIIAKMNLQKTLTEIQLKTMRQNVKSEITNHGTQTQIDPQDVPESSSFNCDEDES